MDKNKKNEGQMLASRLEQMRKERDIAAKATKPLVTATAADTTTVDNNTAPRLSMPGRKKKKTNKKKGGKRR